MCYCDGCGHIVESLNVTYNNDGVHIVAGLSVLSCVDGGLLQRF
jgi:hypothetical protein